MNLIAYPADLAVSTVIFEPGCRNNWHIHHVKSGGGQILVCVASRRYFQAEGQEAVELKPGADCANEWCEAVSEETYAQRK